MKLLIDPAICTGHGRCYQLAPDALGCDDEGYVTPRGEAVEFAADQRDLAEEIVGSCPERAITLISD